MKDENYILIQGWMVNKLKLKDSKLLIYAIIYGFTQDGENDFEGSLNYIVKATNKSKSSVMRDLKSLVSDKLITKKYVFFNNVKFVKYRVDFVTLKQYMNNETTIVKMTPPHSQNETTPIVKLTPNNTSKIILEDNTNNINVENLENSSTKKRTKKKVTSIEKFENFSEGVQNLLFNFIQEMSKYSNRKLSHTSKGNFKPIVKLLESEYGLLNDTDIESIRNMYKDCIKALKGQIESYKGDEEKKKYIQPSTLFRKATFEKYLAIGEEMKPTPTSERNNRDLTSEEINRLQALGSI